MRLDGHDQQTRFLRPPPRPGSRLLRRWVTTSGPAERVVAAPAPISLTASDGAGLELVSLTARRGDRRSARLHRAAPDLPQPGEPGARGALPHHAAVGRDDQPVRHADRRSLAGGGGRRAAGGARRLRGLPAPQAGPGAARGGGGQRVLGARVPHPGGGDEGDRHLVRAGADPRRRAVPAAAARAAARSATLAIRATTVASTGAGKRETRLERRDVHARRATSSWRTRSRAGGSGCATTTWSWRASSRWPRATAPEALGDAARPGRHQRLARARPRRRGGGASSGCWRSCAGSGDSDRSPSPPSTRTWCPCSPGAASGAVGVVGKRILARGALGASDLERALASLAADDQAGQGRTRAVPAGDRRRRDRGRDRRRQAAGARGGARRASACERLDVVAVGGIRDDVMLSRLVTAGLAADGVVLDAPTSGAAELVRRLTHATRSGITIAVEGAGWVWPSVVDGVQPGDEVLVYADLPAERPSGSRSPARRRRRPARWRRRRGRCSSAPGCAPASRASSSSATRVAAKDRDLGGGAQEAGDRSLDPEPRALPVHLAAGAGDRAGLRALRHRAARAGRHPHRRPAGVTLLHRTEIAAPFAAARAVAGRRMTRRSRRARGRSAKGEAATRGEGQEGIATRRVRGRLREGRRRSRATRPRGEAAAAEPAPPRAPRPRRRGGRCRRSAAAARRRGRGGLAQAAPAASRRADAAPAPSRARAESEAARRAPRRPPSPWAACPSWRR